MREHVFDRLTRGTAGALSRRQSLMTLGGAALANALAGSPAVQAGKDSKKVKKRFKKKCKRQVDPCELALTVLCQGQAACMAMVLPCCSTLKTCKAGTSLDCFFAQFN
ncbi:MAG TPA: hypothetical protein VEX37_06040 [Thermomicrobiales bacterium]|nr:hypothetical protein [Thermomicrobiales bacterium]